MNSMSAQVRVQVVDRASAAYANELAYAASMDFNAAHLPGGSSASLVEDVSPVGTTFTFDRAPLTIQQLVRQRSRMRSVS